MKEKLPFTILRNVNAEISKMYVIAFLSEKEEMRS